MRRYKGWSVVALLWVLAGVAHATAAQPGSGVPTPTEAVQSTIDRILTDLRAQSAELSKDATAAYRLIDTAVDQYIDFPLVARLVLAKHWRQATAEQQAVFTQEFRTALVRFYSRALVTYIAEKGVPERGLFEILPERNNPDEKYANVRTLVRQPNGNQIPVDYSLRLSEGRWLIYDVKVEGISVVKSYQSTLAQEIAGKGLQGMIDDLAARNRQALEAGIEVADGNAPAIASLGNRPPEN